MDDFLDKFYRAAREVPKQACPYCWALLDLATNLGSDNKPQKFRKVMPKAGDFTCCGRCGEIGRFDGEELQIVPITEAEWDKLPSKFRDELEATRQVADRLSMELRRARKARKDGAI